MISLPGAPQLGLRLTIALRDSQGNTQELLGVLEEQQTIRKRDGSLATFDPDSITHWRVVTKVDAKAGFGAPLSMRIRELEAAAATTSPADVTQECGNWLLRASKNNPLFQNSALPTGARPFGEPGMEIEAALRKVEEFYRINALPPAITVPLPAYPKLDEYLEVQGWNVAADFNFMVIDTSEISQKPTDTLRAIQIAVSTDVSTDVSTEHLHNYPTHHLTIHIDGQAVGSGQIAFNGGWGVIRNVFVESDNRRHGFGRSIMHALADIARAENCNRLALQVNASDSPARSLFESLHFRLHHRDRCRAQVTR